MRQIFESDRISFTEVSELLIPDYLALVNDRENVQRFIGRPHDPYTAEQETEWVRRKREEKAPVFSLIEKATGEFIGNIELMGMTETEGELGIALTAAKQDRGFGTEAVAALVRYGFDVLGLQRICLRVRPFNARAVRTYLKCGFREFKRTEDHIHMEIRREPAGQDGLDVSRFSDAYTVRRLGEADVEDVFALCGGNTLYYRHCPPFVTRESIREDMRALPPGKELSDKYYVGYYGPGGLTAVLDLIAAYPDGQTAFIGFFMMNAPAQGRGTGSRIVRDLCGYLRAAGFSRGRLAWVKGNPQAEHFWRKNGFAETGTESVRDRYTAITAQKDLREPVALDFPARI
ncbi:MAG: N-acetyltransferase [Lachnospiraceae bacterium]|nr:N-acetyltransferase [Lachnospiraceae bacterium]